MGLKKLLLMFEVPVVFDDEVRVGNVLGEWTGLLVV